MATANLIADEGQPVNPAKISWKDEAYKTIIKQGAWACLSLLILGFLGAELRWFVHNVGTAVTEYVQQSGENIKSLNAAMVNLNLKVDNVVENNVKMQQVLENVSIVHDRQIAQSGQLLNLMEGAHQMMEPVPAKHDEEIKILSEIRDKIEKKQ